MARKRATGAPGVQPLQLPPQLGSTQGAMALSDELTLNETIVTTARSLRASRFAPHSRTARVSAKGTKPSEAPRRSDGVLLRRVRYWAIIPRAITVSASRLTASAP
jgi:hypothetical protein